MNYPRLLSYPEQQDRPRIAATRAHQIFSYSIYLAHALAPRRHFRKRKVVKFELALSERCDNQNKIEHNTKRVNRKPRVPACDPGIVPTCRYPQSAQVPLRTRKLPSEVPPKCLHTILCDPRSWLYRRFATSPKRPNSIPLKL